MWLLLILAVATTAVVAGLRRAGRGSGRFPVPRRGRRGALTIVIALLGLQALAGAPAYAQPLDCTEPPTPGRPGTGMVGALDPAPIGVGQSGSAYDKYGYAGQVWHTYDLGCGPQGVNNPNAMVDTWIGNQLFNVAKNLVGVTNALHYSLLSGDLMEPLDDMIAEATVALYDSVFTPWFGVVAVILAVLLFRYIWRGDLASIGKRTTWALAGLWLASATYLTPLVYTQALDDVVITGTSAVQGGFLREVGFDERDGLPTLLHDQVVYRGWLRGEFGDPDSAKAEELGMELLDAQAWTKREVLSGAADGSAQEKQQQFEDVASRMGGAYGYLQGVDGSRIGAGMLSMLQALAYTTFQLLAKAAILLAQLLLRVLILTGPLIGLIAILHHDVLRGVGRIAGSALLNVVVISAMAGVHTVVLNLIFAPQSGFALLTQIALAGLLTLIFLMIGKPIRRMGQMVQLSAGFAGGALPSPPSLFSRSRGGRSDGQQSGAQDDFWDRVRASGGEEDSAASGGSRTGHGRPESVEPPVAVTSERVDRPASRRDGGQEGAVPGAAIPAARAGGTSAEDNSGGGQQRPGATQRATGALPAAGAGGESSRMVDTSPISDGSWNERDQDPVVVPSRVGGSGSVRGTSTDTDRRPDNEFVRGRPVNVVYRPSRGLEVSDE
ncbi:hypothetical protein SAMN04487904_10321 [Actinopolyspora lacussalsi subsp. righensis]|uniref:TrbL/VirB6 plasmid conjugal transfer protein n=1 Tax=Actinopolyspora righensis TaxID=995060 RepID=A0A1I6YN47_9ACTN|nr:hypothetical protein [Actinopolyspora righensis]SFT51949.1 hypothetical protein SAMN04487904_10321 [Actinopolyspora righensis]